MKKNARFSAVLLAACISVAAPAHAEVDEFRNLVTLTAKYNGRDYAQSESWSSLDGPLTKPTEDFLYISDGYTKSLQNGWADTTAGVLKAYSYASVYANKGTAAASAVSEARSHTVLTINSAGLTGQRGWMSFSLETSALLYSELTWGAPDSPPFGSNNVSLTIRTGNQPAGTLSTHTDFSTGISGSTSCIWYGGLPDCTTITFPSTGYLPLTFNVPFTYGTPLPIDESLTTVVQGKTQELYKQGWFSAYADASHSVYWGGISSVTFNGLPVTYSITSDSGVDWLHDYTPAAVPEPCSALLMLGGLGLAGLRARRWKTAAPASSVES